MSNSVVTRSNHGPDQPRNIMGISSVELLPCMLVTAVAGTIEPHSVASGSAVKALVQINSNTQKTIDGTYAAGESVTAGVYQSGVPVNVLVAAGASAILASDYLESDGTGHFRKVEVDPDTDETQRGGVLAQAEVDLDNSASADPARLKAVWL